MTFLVIFVRNFHFQIWAKRQVYINIQKVLQEYYFTSMCFARKPSIILAFHRTLCIKLRNYIIFNSLNLQCSYTLVLSRVSSAVTGLPQISYLELISNLLVMINILECFHLFLVIGQQASSNEQYDIYFGDSILASKKVLSFNNQSEFNKIVV